MFTRAPGLMRRPPGLWTDVETEQELRRARQVVRAFAAQEAESPRDGDVVGLAFVTRGGCPSGPVDAEQDPSGKDQTRIDQTRIDSLGGGSRDTGWFHSSYLPVALGAMLLAVGLGFLAVAVLARQADWWQPGLPLTILGQAALTVAILWRMDVLRHSQV